MQLKRKLISLTLSMMLLVASFMNIQAESDEVSISRNEKANILNELAILKGDGTDYNLDGQLKRSEAAAFIVRLLGKETEVIGNKDSYVYTSYSDVSPDEWYAPYVGYCDKQAIINGYQDGTFKPNDYLSEKAFLKMLLAALDYAYNVDYSWNNVFLTAFTSGIVDDESYKLKKDDNYSYTRGDVVSAIFSTLKAQNKKTKLRMIQSFVDTLIISKDTAISYGLIEDDIATTITSVTTKNETTIEVVFNEVLSKLELENFKIYATNNLTAEVVVKSITLVTGSTYTIVLEAAQKIDQDYILNVSGVVDQYGNQTSQLNSQFVGYRPDEVKSDYFLISKIQPISKNVINVYFTQPINENALVPSYYTLKKQGTTTLAGTSANMQVSKIATVDNGITIYFKNYEFTTEESYELAIDGKTTSLYGVNLKNGVGDSVKFKSIITENIPLEMQGINVLNSKTIELIFNKEINPVIAEQVFSYYITSSTNTAMQIEKAVVDDTTGQSVRITLVSAMTLNQKYNVMINNINDISKQFSITEKSYEYVGTYSAATNVKVTGVSVIDTQTLEIYVSRPLDEVSAVLTSNYQISGVTDYGYLATPSAVYYDTKNPYVVKIYLPENRSLVSGKNYEARILSSIKDYIGNTQTATEVYSFANSAGSKMETIIGEAKIIGAGVVKLSFTKELALDVSNVLNTNYGVSYLDGGQTFNKKPIGVSYINPKTIVLRFDSLDENIAYTLTFTKLVNYGNVATTNTNGKYQITLLNGQ